MTDNHYHKLAN